MRSLPQKPAPEQTFKHEKESPVAEATVLLRANQTAVLPLFMLANLSVYGTGIAIALLMDGETSNQFFFVFAKINDEVRRLVEIVIP